MSDFLSKITESTPDWNGLSDIKDARANLGDEMPVFIYRLFEFSMKDELTSQFGKEKTIDIFRRSGERAGIEFATNLLNLSLEFNEFIAHLQDTIQKNKIGILRIESFDHETGRAVLTVGEDVDCSGLPVTGETVCNYDEGFLAGILKMYTKRNYVVTEVDCWATGARVCRFHAEIK